LKVAVITNEVYVEIELLRKHGMSLRKIAVEVGCAVNTVRSHLAAEDLPRYQRRKLKAGKLTPFETYLRERQLAARPGWIPASVLMREIAALGYSGKGSQLRAFMRGLRPSLPVDPVVRFETAPGEQMQVDWVEFRKGRNPLYAFCATLGFSRASFVGFVTDMKVETLIRCHEDAFVAFGGICQRVLYDNMKTVVLERDASGQGEHRFHAGFLDYARHCGFVIKLCRPYRAKTKGKVERFNGYLRPLVLCSLGGTTGAGWRESGCGHRQQRSPTLACRSRQSTHSWDHASASSGSPVRGMSANAAHALAR
jgi:transposase